MNEHKSFCEYIVTPETGAKGMLLRVVLMLIYALVAAGYTFFFWILLRQWQPLILLPFIIYALINITWRFVMVEYEFAVEAGELTVAKIYGKKARRKKFSADISDFTVIRPLDNESRKLADAPDTELLDFSAHPDSEDRMICVLPEKRTGKKKAVIIETDEDMRRLMRLSNPSAFSRY